MSWIASFGVALLAAAFGCVGSGFVASLYVDWYRVTSREGAAGYLVVSIGLVGLVVGFVLGLVTARAMAGSAHPGFVAGLGVALGTELVLLGAIAGVGRALADVPPLAQGERLWLVVEVRTSSPTVPARLEIASLSGETLRVRQPGVLFEDDARVEGADRIVPGIAPLFTTRGRPLLGAGPVEGDRAWIQLPAWPARPSAAWSDWLPRARPGGSAEPFPFAARYRVVRADEPVRSAAEGPFVVSTVVRWLQERADPLPPSPGTRFRVTYAGARVALERDGSRSDEFGEAHVVAGPRPALLVHAEVGNGPAAYYLLDEEGGALRRALVSEAPPGDVRPLTADLARWRAARDGTTPGGWLDRALIAHPGLYLVGGDALLDTRVLSVRRFRVSPDLTLNPSIPPLGISPDERSIVRFGWAQGNEARPVLAAIDTLSGKNDLLPVDRARMRFMKYDDVDPAWMAHHFEWVRREDGVDRLAARAAFDPLPYHGEIQWHEKDRPVYWLNGATEPVRAAVMELLVREFHAGALPAAPDAYEKPMRVEGQTVEVACGSGSSAYVCVSMERGAKDTGLVQRIAARFDAELATGRLDALFAP